jgi:hypothetical protein
LHIARPSWPRYGDTVPPTTLLSPRQAHRNLVGNMLCGRSTPSF